MPEDSNFSRPECNSESGISISSVAIEIIAEDIRREKTRVIVSKVGFAFGIICFVLGLILYFWGLTTLNIPSEKGPGPQSFMYIGLLLAVIGTPVIYITLKVLTAEPTKRREMNNNIEKRLSLIREKMGSE